MCRCTSTMRTPFCGRPGCEWPRRQPDKWERRFLDLAHVIAGWSKDPSTKTGAVIVRPDRTIAGVGYNGFARSCDDHATFYEDRDEKLGRVIHAEMNAILSAREPLHGYTLYSTFMTCDRCAVHAIQAGIKRVIAPIAPADKAERWGPMLQRARDCFGEARIHCEEVAYDEASS